MRYGRLLTVLLLVATWFAHHHATAGLPNTPTGMLAYHGSAALVDLFILATLPRFLAGQLCDDLQTTCLLSIVANFAGWLAYMAYAPPSYYNTVMLGLSIVQFIRLLLVDGDAYPAIGRGVVRRPHLGCT